MEVSPQNSQGIIVLSLNSGSSSLKLGLYSISDERPQLLASGEVEAIGSVNESRVHLRSDSKQLVDERRAIGSMSEAAKLLIGVVAQAALPSPHVIGHRIVHGGPELREHQ